MLRLESDSDTVRLNVCDEYDVIIVRVAAECFVLSLDRCTKGAATYRVITDMFSALYSRCFDIRLFILALLDRLKANAHLSLIELSVVSMGHGFIPSNVPCLCAQNNPCSTTCWNKLHATVRLIQRDKSGNQGRDNGDEEAPCRRWSN